MNRNKSTTTTILDADFNKTTKAKLCLLSAKVLANIRGGKSLSAFQKFFCIVCVILDDIKEFTAKAEAINIANSKCRKELESFHATYEQSSLLNFCDNLQRSYNTSIKLHLRKHFTQEQVASFLNSQKSYALDNDFHVFDVIVKLSFQDSKVKKYIHFLRINKEAYKFMKSLDLHEIVEYAKKQQVASETN